MCSEFHLDLCYAWVVSTDYGMRMLSTQPPTSRSVLCARPRPLGTSLPLSFSPSYPVLSAHNSDGHRTAAVLASARLIFVRALGWVCGHAAVATASHGRGTFICSTCTCRSAVRLRRSHQHHPNPQASLTPRVSLFCDGDFLLILCYSSGLLHCRSPPLLSSIGCG